MNLYKIHYLYPIILKPLYNNFLQQYILIYQNQKIANFLNIPFEYNKLYNNTQKLDNLYLIDTDDLKNDIDS